MSWVLIIGIHPIMHIILVMWNWLNELPALYTNNAYTHRIKLYAKNKSVFIQFVEIVIFETSKITPINSCQ